MMAETADAAPSLAAAAAAASTDNPAAAELAAAAKGDLAPLMKLLEKPPGEVAAWTVAQMKDLSEAETLVESLPIFKVAGALKDAPVEQKEALIRSMMQGVGDLPVEQRTDALRLFTQMSAPGAESLEGSPSKSPSASSVLSANMACLAKEAEITEMKPEEMQTLTQTVQKEQGCLIQPLLDVVPELSEDERKQVTNALVTKGVVSEEKRAMLEEAIKPGGHADELVSVMKWLSIFKYWWLLFIVPIVEGTVVLGLAFGTGCSVPLVVWLTVDGMVGMKVAWLAYFTKRALQESITKLSENPMGFVTEVQASMENGVKLLDAIPGASSAIYLVVGMVGLIVIGSFLVILGVLKLVESFSFTADCGEPSRLFAISLSIPIMVLRVYCPVAVACKMVHIAKKVQQAKDVSEVNSRAQSSQSSAPLLSDPEANYGSVEQQPPV